MAVRIKFCHTRFRQEPVLSKIRLRLALLFILDSKYTADGDLSFTRGCPKLTAIVKLDQ